MNYYINDAGKEGLHTQEKHVNEKQRSRPLILVESSCTEAQMRGRTPVVAPAVGV